MMQFPIDKYERLVTRILAGEVVFFVGAGFSLDSEGNSAGRLIARLIVRFLALTQKLPKNTTEDLRWGLRRTFKLGNDEKICSEATIGKVSARYYDINDWITNAFETLLAAALKLDKADDVLKRINILENRLLKKLKLNGRPDKVALEAIDLAKFSGLPVGERGKALFLETLGFCRHEIMAGRFENAALEEVMADFRGLIRDRHRVLARLAREGLCPLLITTNYDLLLEGACRLAGFNVLGFSAPNPVTEKDHEPPATYGRLTRIGAPADFFESGAGFRSALLVKIHGCADRYRHERKSAESWSAYLPSIVFTYREIQNWRKDSWSRDLVSTLLRTRTMVLCGYSGADPVLHDTFRTVYEEIHAQNRGRVNAGAADKVRAYFTGGAASLEFYGIEILRAASRAAGIENPKLTEHENYLPFYFLNEAKFPTMDEMLTWVGHRTMRGLQKGALRTNLRRTATQLLREPVPEADLESVRRNFEELEKAEQEIAKGWSDQGPSHWEFGRVAGWTDRFHSALLREFALAETVQRNQGPGLNLERLRTARAYFPISDQPGWAAWGVVIEVALRRMLQAIRDKNGDWCSDHRWVEPAICEYPALLFSSNESMPSPVCLLLRFAAFERPGYLPEIRGVYKRLVMWDLCPGIETHAPIYGPSSRDLWDWAIAPGERIWTEKEKSCVRKWLGEAESALAGLPLKTYHAAQ